MDAAVTAEVWVGVIEWGDDQDLDIFVASSEHAVRVCCMRAVAVAEAWQIADDGAFLADHPPAADDDHDAVIAWLDALHAATSIPWITVRQVPLDSGMH